MTPSSSGTRVQALPSKWNDDWDPPIQTSFGPEPDTIGAPLMAGDRDFRDGAPGVAVPVRRDVQVAHEVDSGGVDVVRARPPDAEHDVGGETRAHGHRGAVPVRERASPSAGGRGKRPGEPDVVRRSCPDGLRGAEWRGRDVPTSARKVKQAGGSADRAAARPAEPEIGPAGPGGADHEVPVRQRVVPAPAVGLAPAARGELRCRQGQRRLR